MPSRKNPAAGNLPGLHKGLGAASPPCPVPSRPTPQHPQAVPYPRAMDRIVKVRSFGGQQQPATVNGFGLKGKSREGSAGAATGGERVTKNSIFPPPLETLVKPFAFILLLFITISSLKTVPNAAPRRDPSRQLLWFCNAKEKKKEKK